MNKKRFLSSFKEGRHAFIFISAVFCIITGFGFYHAILGFIYARMAYLKYITAGLIIVSAIFLFFAVNLLYSLRLRIIKEHNYLKDLQAFKELTDSLLHASSEIEAYETLCTHMLSIPNVDRAVVVYHEDASTTNDLWEKAPDEEETICLMPPSTCPIFTHGHRCIVDDMNKEGTFCPHQLAVHNHGSYMCSPLEENDSPNAIIQLYSEKENTFDPFIAYKVDTYLEIAIPIICSKKAMSLLNRKASTDKLTKLYNRNFLDPYLENQIEAANLTNQQISLIMVDMDHFKSINDTYGHIAGDHVLSIFAQLVLKCVRRTDLIARYGGDEFIVVLPSTDTETAAVIGERIRETVSETYIPPVDGVIIPSISCSVGISTYPIHCNSKESLIKTSDIALYKAKLSGRNKTMIYVSGLAG